MQILSCDDITLLRKLMDINSKINVVKYVIAILMIIMIIYDVLRSKDRNSLYHRLLIKIPLTLSIFFLPNIVYKVGEMFDNTSSFACFKYANDEYINELKKKKKSSEEKKVYDIKTKINNLKNSLSINEYNTILEDINNIKDSNMGLSIKEELLSLKKYIDIKTNIDELKLNYNYDKHLELLDTINKIEDNTFKEKLNKFFLELNLKKPLTISKGLLEKTYHNMSYYEVIPPHPVENMALIIYLHGDGGYIKNNYNTYYMANGSCYKKEEFIYIAPTHKDFKNGKTWESQGIIDELKELIDKVVIDYKIDRERIIITGESRGAIGVWDIASKYSNYFSAIVPISCRASKFNPVSFKNSYVWAFSGDQGMEIDYSNMMQNYVNQINNNGGHAKYTKMPGKSHGDMMGTFINDEIIEWALLQRKLG